MRLNEQLRDIRSDVLPDSSPRRFDRSLLKSRTFLVGATICAVVGVAAGFGLGPSIRESTATGPVDDVIPAKFTVLKAPRLLPEIGFQDEIGKSLMLSAFHGKVVLLNIWATWCSPCRAEMPTLDRLQKRLGGDKFAVVALSIDFNGVKAIRDFYKEVGIKNLTIYIDESGKTLDNLHIRGVPATLLIDRQGREVGRMLGPAEWDSPEFLIFLDRYINPITNASAY